MRKFQRWLKYHRSFPEEYQEFILRDILNYTKREIEEMDWLELNLALNYAMETYVRRDLVFVLTKIFANKKGSGNEINLLFNHPEIEEYIKESYQFKKNE